jgi:citrate synthase
MLTRSTSWSTLVSMSEMSSYVRAAEAARLLGISTSTLYAYVSRGRISRRKAPDGRSSLFALDEIERLANTTRRAPLPPRPTIDVQIASRVTSLTDDAVRLRGHPLTDLVADHHFEDVAELLWSGTIPERPTTWSPVDAEDRTACAPIGDFERIGDVVRIEMAAAVLDAGHPTDDGPAAARRLLRAVPHVLGASRRTGSYATRVASIWRRRPSEQLVRAIDVALMALADHELAPSTLAARVAASVRSSPYGAFVAGLAAVEGALHGSASALAHRFLEECASDEPAVVIRRYRERAERIPGFGHKVYRGRDPRFDLIMAAVRELPVDPDRLAFVDLVVAETGRAIPQHPNVDMALGALTWAEQLRADIPIFAIARIAGWGAHYAEEVAEPAVRYRGVARTP